MGHAIIRQILQSTVGNRSEYFAQCQAVFSFSECSFMTMSEAKGAISSRSTGHGIRVLVLD